MLWMLEDSSVLFSKYKMNLIILQKNIEKEWRKHNKINYMLMEMKQKTIRKIIKDN